MLEAITPEIRYKLGQIGFEQDEINAIETIHKLKKEKHSIRIEDTLSKTIATASRKQLLDAIDELSWDMGEKQVGCREELYDR